MATMKEVAKLAGVSVSTVSNIVNGLKSVNSDIVKKVEKAMSELGYIPNANAQGLRSKKSNSFGIIIPDIKDPIYADIVSGIENVAKLSGYQIQLFITGDFPELEIDALNNLQNQQVEVVFLATCMPNDTHYTENLTKKNIKFIFIRRKPIKFIQGSFVFLDEYTAIYNCIKNFDSHSIKSASLMTLDDSYSNEKECTDAFFKACNKFNIKICEVAHIKMGKEHAFKTVAWWLKKDNVPDVILATNRKLLEGAKAGIDFFKNEKNPHVLAIDSFSWTHDVFDNLENFLLQNFYELGATACRKALSLIKTPNILLNETIKIEAKEIYEKKSLSNINFKQPSKLKMLLIKSSFSYATSRLVNKFCQNTNVEIDVTTVLENEFNDILLENDYDIFQIPQNLIDSFSKVEKILCLNDFKISSKLQQYYSNSVIDVYSKVSKNVYALPYIVDCQLLFYRQDLFNSMHLKRLYFETYKTDLTLPKSFKEYNQIAKFFTKQFNNESPVLFGNVICNDNKSVFYNFMQRVWEYIGDTSVDLKNVDANIIKLALNDLRNCYTYAEKTSIDFTIEKKIEFMNNGNCAMMIANQSDYLNYVNSNFISSNEKIYSAVLPNNNTVTTGYSLAVNNNCNFKEEAIAFLDWFSSNDVSVANNLLGGTVPNKYAISSNELSLTNPWLKICCDNIFNSHPVNLNLQTKNAENNTAFDIIYGYLKDEITLDLACEQLKEIPQNCCTILST